MADNITGFYSSTIMQHELHTLARTVIDVALYRDLSPLEIARVMDTLEQHILTYIWMDLRIRYPDLHLKVNKAYYEELDKP